MSVAMSEKINRVLRMLIPNSGKSTMMNKHSAALLSGGKPISMGHNHLRSCNCNKVMLSYHAEMHALHNYFNSMRQYGLRSFINDSHYTMLGRKNEQYLLRQAKVAWGE